VRDRRAILAAIAVVLPVVAGAAHSGSPLVSRAGPAATVRIVAGLERQGYAVRETVGRGNPTVLVLSDVHDSTITGATLDGLDSLRRVFAFDVVGLENQDHDFRLMSAGPGRPSPLVAVIESLVTAASPELLEWTRATIRRRSYGVGPRVGRYLKDHRASTFGMERGDSSMMFVRVAYLYAELLHGDRRSATDSTAPALSEDARRRGIESLGAYLAARDPSCPCASTEDPERDITPYVTMAWVNRFVLDDRNRGFAESVRAELARRGGSRAVVLVGYAHTSRAGGWPSLQARLQESGATVIVADPPAVQRWLVLHPEVKR
jgi:hypothetical protein